MISFEKAKILSVKARRAYWQWRAANVTKAQFTGVLRPGCELGVVLSGGEFTIVPNAIYGHNYGYPPLACVDYYAATGMRIIRLPIVWERIQPTMYAPLDVQEMGRIDEVVSHAIAQGMKVGIDLHNSGYRWSDLIGSKAVPDEAFAHLWGEIARHYKDQPEILFMLMSEPYDQCARQWIRTANKAIAAIRATGATQTIVVPGSYYDGGWTWTKSDNAKVVGEGVKDPLNNFMFEIHQYMDANAAGGTAGIVSPTIGADRLADVTNWARARGHQLFLGEFAAASDPTSMTALRNMLQYLAENGDVWKYATWWGGGDRWANYQFGLDPADYDNPVDQPQMALLKQFMNREQA